MSCIRANISGQRFGSLIAIEYVGDKQYPCGKKLSMWKCKCNCGNETVVSLCALRRGHNKSCGCLERKHKNEFGVSHIKHGDAHSRLYNIWVLMKMRCYNKNNRAYKYYGAKGVSVCDEWRNDYGKFYEWAYANGYDENAKWRDCTIDRINPFGNYEPQNCRWITMEEQYKNLRRHWKGDKANG